MASTQHKKGGASQDLSDAEAAKMADQAAVGEAEEGAQGESGKLKMVLSILRQFVGVKDMASVRFSLPSQLIEPIPNLEYWNYLDRPEYFVTIGDSADPLERMLAVIRWLFTKDLKLIHGRVCKPYNSVLGEFFRCHWDVDAVPAPLSLGAGGAETETANTASVSSKSSRFKPSFSRKNTAASTRAASPTPSSGSAAGGETLTPLTKPVRCAFICEQTSHHPPVSAYTYSCPEKGVEACGMDQIAAKFTGTSVKVKSGEFNHGIFVKLAKHGDEEYQCLHPTASVAGFLRGTLYAAVQDECIVTCPKSGLAAVIQYKDDPWIGKPKYAIEGMVYKWDSTKSPTPSAKSFKEVPESDVVARIDGCYRKRIHFTPTKKGASTEKQVLVDVSDLQPLPKRVPAAAEQKENESRQVWKDVTRAIEAKQFTRATKEKNEVEDRQRALAKKRKETGDRHVAVYFEGGVDRAGNLHDVDVDLDPSSRPGTAPSSNGRPAGDDDDDDDDDEFHDAEEDGTTNTEEASGKSSLERKVAALSVFDGRPKLTAAGRELLRSQLEA